MIQSILQFDMSENQIKWVIFLVLLALFPAVFFLLFVVPIWPVLFVILRIVPTIFVSGDFTVIAAFILEITFWSSSFYFVSRLLARSLSAMNHKAKFMLLAIIFFIVIGTAMLPLYDFYYRSSKTEVSAFFLYSADEVLSF